MNHTHEIKYKFQIFKAKSNFKIELLHFIGIEEISKEYEFIIWISINAQWEEIENLLGCYASICADSNSETHFFNGIIDEVECYRQSLNSEGTLQNHLKIKLKSILSLMQRSQRFTIFQNLSRQEIIRELANRYALSFKISGVNEDEKKIEYYNQFNISDYQLLQKILSDLNLYFYFKHDFSEHILICENNLSASKGKIIRKFALNYTESGSDIEVDQIYDLSILYKNTLISSTAATYNYQNPKSILKSTYPSPSKAADYQVYPINTQTHEQTDRCAKDMLLAREAESLNYDLLTTITHLSLGDIIQIEKKQNQYEAKDLFIHKIIHIYTSRKENIDEEIEQFFKDHNVKKNIAPILSKEITYFNYIQTIPHDKPYVVNHNITSFQNPSPLPARVVSPQNQATAIDAKGRIPIQFFWESGNYSTTCWVPLAQSLVGRNWGTMSIPRPGMDVIVGFLHGDINHPIIMGCLSNDENKLSPEQINQPWSLSYLSNSLSDPKFSSLLAVSDQNNNEKIYIKAGRNLECKVNNSMLFDVNQDSTLLIKNGKGSILLEGKEASFNIQVGKTSVKISNGEVSIFSKNPVNIISEKDIHLNSQQSIQFKAPFINFGTENMKINATELSVTTQATSLYASKTINIKAGIKVSLDFPGKTHLFPMK